MSPDFPPEVKSRMRQKAERIKFEQRLESLVNQYCENCRGELRSELEVWVHYSRRFEGDDEPGETHYCDRCISVDGSRRKAPAWRQGD